MCTQHFRVRLLFCIFVLARAERQTPRLSCQGGAYLGPQRLVSSAQSASGATGSDLASHCGRRAAVSADVREGGASVDRIFTLGRFPSDAGMCLKYFQKRERGEGKKRFCYPPGQAGPSVSPIPPRGPPGGRSPEAGEVPGGTCAQQGSPLHLKTLMNGDEEILPLTMCGMHICMPARTLSGHR